MGRGSDSQYPKRRLDLNLIYKPATAGNDCASLMPREFPILINFARTMATSDNVVIT